MDKSYKILVVDDEPDVVEILRYNLEKEYYQVFKAYNGLEAIESAMKNLPDFIIMDVKMTGLSGIETCSKLRLIKKLRNTPVLFLTADSDEYTMMSAFEAGANHFITKPIRPAILLEMINELINK